MTPLILINLAYRRLHIAYLRHRIAAAEFDCACIQAEMLTAPYRLIDTRIFITDMQAKAAALEARP
jgi:hypothetical protein